MSLVSFLKGRGRNGFGAGSTAEEVTVGLDLSQKTYLITGCNSGLGRETARVLGLRGARIVAVARNEASAEAALNASGADGTKVACDLSEPSSVRACVEQVKAKAGELDGIICNAGIMALPTLEVKYGLELQFLTNHMGHFILVNGLVDRLAASGRVVVLSSSAHQMARGGIDFDNLDGSRGYSAWSAYGRSKLANLLFAKKLAERFKGGDRTANAVHPGVINTNLGRHLNGFIHGVFAALKPIFLKTEAEGAATSCYVAAHEDVAAVSGLYFADCNPKKPSAVAEDPELALKLWQKSEELAQRI